MATATIKMFLAHGDPKRLRTAELSNWTGKVVAGPRSDFEEVLARDESEKSGIYLLMGTDLETGKPAIYIGEAESIRSRIKSHVDKDFWNQAIYFVSKDENLTKAHIRYLEGRLIELCRKAERAHVTNGQGSGAKLPESDREDMEVFLEKMCQLLPVLGVDLFVPASSAPPGRKRLWYARSKVSKQEATGLLTDFWFLRIQRQSRVKEHPPKSGLGLKICGIHLNQTESSLKLEIAWCSIKTMSFPAQVQQPRSCMEVTPTG